MNGSPRSPLPDFRVAIVGSREYPELFDVHSVIDSLVADAEGCQNVVIVSGGASGVDTEAVEYAKTLGLDWIVINPDWKGLGKRAGYVRNEQVVEGVHQVIALWDGESKGTKHTIDLALKKRKPLEVVFP